jgi:hypothetical protein
MSYQGSGRIVDRFSTAGEVNISPVGLSGAVPNGFST